MSTNLEEWLRRLRDSDMPIFSRTVYALNEAMEGSRSGTLELSRIILEDPTLTAKILKLSNSPYYNPGRQRLATVTRAIVLIGLQTVRDLALACAFIETVLSRPNKAQVQHEIARSLHAAVQAKSLAILMNDPQPEEVFIAALLNNIGEVVFWCFEQEQGEKINQRIEQGMPQEQAEREVLGFKLRQMGAALSRHWKLGDLVDASFETANPSARAELARLACRIAHDSEGGWDELTLQPLLERIAELTQRPPQEVAAQLQLNSQTAIKLAQTFGAEACAAYIPQQLPNQPATPEPTPQLAPEPAENHAKSSNTLIQVLNDIAAMMVAENAPHLTVVLDSVTEGIFRALEMDRVLLLLMDPMRKQLRESIALGWPSLKTRALMHFPVQSVPHNLISYVMEKRDVLLLSGSVLSAYSGLFSPTIVAQLGKHECLTAPIGLPKSPIGLVYADRAHSEKPLSQESCDAFKQLIFQANLAIRLCKKPA